MKLDTFCLTCWHFDISNSSNRSNRCESEVKLLWSYFYRSINVLSLRRCSNSWIYQAMNDSKCTLLFSTSNALHDQVQLLFHTLSNRKHEYCNYSTNNSMLYCKHHHIVGRMDYHDQKETLLGWRWWNEPHSDEDDALSHIQGGGTFAEKLVLLEEYHKTSVQWCLSSQKKEFYFVICI